MNITFKKAWLATAIIVAVLSLYLVSVEARDVYPEAARSVAVRLIPQGEYNIPKDGDWTVRRVSVNSNLTIEDSQYVTYLSHEAADFINDQNKSLVCFPLMVDAMWQVESHCNFYDRSGPDWGIGQINRCHWYKKINFTFGEIDSIQVTKIDPYELTSVPRIGAAISAWEMSSCFQFAYRFNGNKDLFRNYLCAVAGYNCGQGGARSMVSRSANNGTLPKYWHTNKIIAVYSWQQFVCESLLEKYTREDIISRKINQEEMEIYIKDLCS